MNQRIDTRNPLDEEVALRLLGYRWVVWKSRDRFPYPKDEEGRFLAPPDGPLAGEQAPAGPRVPLAKEPDRYVPMFSSDVGAAFDVARRVGLFVAANASLTISAPDEWRVLDENGRLLGEGVTLPEAICRAALEWARVHAPAPLRTGTE